MRLAGLFLGILFLVIPIEVDAVGLLVKAPDAHPEIVLALTSDDLMTAGGLISRARISELNWSLDGSVDEIVDRFIWSPRYGIRKLDSFIKSPGGTVDYAANVSLPWNDQKEGREFGLNPFWAASKRTPLLVVFVWLVDGSASQVKAIPVYPGDENVEVVMEVKFDLSVSESKGHPAVLLWAENEWITPDARMPRKLQPAFEALMRNDLEGLRREIEKGVDPLGSSEAGVSLLTFAAEAGLNQGLEILMEKMSVRTKEGLKEKIQAPVWSANNGRKAAVELMLKHGLEFKGEASWARGPVRAAINGNHADVLRLLVGKVGADQLRAEMAIALAAGQLSLVEILAEGKGPEWFDQRDMAAALYSRVRANDARTVKWLLDRGAHSLLDDKVHGRLEIRDPSASPDTVMGPFRPAFFSSDSGKSEYAVARRTAGDESPLMVAVRNNAGEVTALLLEHGFDPNVETTDGESALIFAVRSGFEEIVNQLLAAGASVNLSDGSGWTALHHGGRRGDLDICNLLMQRGADLMARTGDGETPLIVAWRHGAMETAEALFAREPRALDPGGRTTQLAQRAIAVDAAGLLKILVEVEPNRKRLDVSTLLDWARIAEASTCEEWLRTAGGRSDDLHLVSPKDLTGGIKVKEQVPPDDPRIGRELYERRVVNVSGVIDLDGSVILPVVDADEDGALAAASIRAVEQWRFAVPQIEGRAVRVKARIPIAFRAKDLTEVPRLNVSSAPVYKSNHFDPRVVGKGRLVLEFSIDEVGRASDFVVLYADDLEYAVSMCVSVGLADFGPAKVDGRAVNCRWLYYWQK